MKLKEKLLEDKIFLAEKSLTVATEVLEDIQTLAKSGEVGVRDLIAVFNSAIKTHRDLVSDIRGMEEEIQEPASVEKNYRSKVDELLNNLRSVKE